MLPFWRKNLTSLGKYSNDCVGEYNTQNRNLVHIFTHTCTLYTTKYGILHTLDVDLHKKKKP